MEQTGVISSSPTPIQSVNAIGCGESLMLSGFDKQDISGGTGLGARSVLDFQISLIDNLSVTLSRSLMVNQTKVRGALRGLIRFRASVCRPFCQQRF